MKKYCLRYLMEGYRKSSYAECFASFIGNNHQVKWYKTVLCTALTLFGGLHARAQFDLKTYVNTTPPNIASFERYGNMPVNYSTGQISENIHLYTFDVDPNIKIPIDLGYSNSGLKPDEIPSWVGHGWNLMPGGYISQEIRGTDDFLPLPGGFAHDPGVRPNLKSYINGTMTAATDKYNYIKNVLKGLEDSQPDIFSLNLLGKTTEFYFDETGVKFIHYEPYQVELLSPIGFIITDEKGYKYYFINSIANSGTHVNDPYEYASTGGTRSWNLDKIVTPNGEVVAFQYVSDAIYTTTNSSATYTYGSFVVPIIAANPPCALDFKGPMISESTSTVAQSVLKSISYRGRAINFNTIARNDIKTIPGSIPKALASIQVLNENNLPVKTVQFTYNNNLRLRLDNVAVLDNLTGAPVQNYKFDYYTSIKDLTDIPLITSANRTYALDHWGYYNRAEGNSPVSVTQLDYSRILPITVPLNIGSNNHYADGSASLIGMLQKITYPTGGYSQIEYEPNQISSSTLATPWYVNTANAPLVTDILTQTATCPTGGGEGLSGEVTGTFVIDHAVSNASVTWEFASNIGSICSFKIQQVTPNNPVIITQSGNNTSGSRYYTLPTGTYQYTLEPVCEFAESTTTNAVYLSVTEDKVPPGGLICPIGGNRVLRVKDFDRLGNLAGVRKFQYAGAELNQEPSYIGTYNSVGDPPQEVNETDLTQSCGPVYSIGEHNLAAQTGFLITYRQVTELLGENGENGKNIYYYGSQASVADNFNVDPFPPITYLSWRDNDIQRKEVYKNVGASFFKVQSTGYSYTPTPLPYSAAPDILKGIKFGVKGNVDYGNEYAKFYKQYFNTANVYLPVDRYAPATVSDTLFNDNGTFVSTQTVNSYTTQDFLLSKTVETNSDNKIAEKDTWYTNDFNSGVANISALQTNHIIGQPLKTIDVKAGNITGGNVLTRDNHGNIIQIYDYENNQLVAPPAHDPANYYPSLFALKNTLSYSIYDQLVEFTKTNDAPVAILWGYNGSYPIAEVKNATYQSLVTVLGQSTVDQLTGINPGTDDQVRSSLNVLRTDPRLKDAQVSTFTYAPLIGMTSSTDAKGETTYYEYDNLRRLRNVKDKDGNIVKHNEYHYQGQLTN